MTIGSFAPLNFSRDNPTLGCTALGYLRLGVGYLERRYDAKSRTEFAV
jgi:hypothetical protein